MQTCTLFAKYLSWMSRDLQTIDPDLAGKTKPATMSKQQWARNLADRERHNASTSSNSSKSADEQPIEKMNDMLKKYEEHFSRHLQILLDALNHYAATETVVLLGLCARLSTANQGTEYSGLRTDQEGAA